MIHDRGFCTAQCFRCEGLAGLVSQSRHLADLGAGPTKGAERERKRKRIEREKDRKRKIQSSNSHLNSFHSLPLHGYQSLPRSWTRPLALLFLSSSPSKFLPSLSMSLSLLVSESLSVSLCVSSPTSSSLPLLYLSSSPSLPLPPSPPANPSYSILAEYLFLQRYLGGIYWQQLSQVYLHLDISLSTGFLKIPIYVTLYELPKISSYRSWRESIEDIVLFSDFFVEIASPCPFALMLQVRQYPCGQMSFQ